jgi:hypothetical protein
MTYANTRTAITDRNAGYVGRFDMADLLEALTSDYTPRVDSTRYRRYRLQQFGRILKTSTEIFLKERVK